MERTGRAPFGIWQLVRLEVGFPALPLSETCPSVLWREPSFLEDTRQDRAGE